MIIQSSHLLFCIFNLLLFNYFNFVIFSSMKVILSKEHVDLQESCLVLFILLKNLFLLSRRKSFLLYFSKEETECGAIVKSERNENRWSCLGLIDETRDFRWHPWQLDDSRYYQRLRNSISHSIWNHFTIFPWFRTTTNQFRPVMKLSYDVVQHLYDIDIKHFKDVVTISLRHKGVTKFFVHWAVTHLFELVWSSFENLSNNWNNFSTFSFPYKSSFFHLSRR